MALLKLPAHGTIARLATVLAAALVLAGCGSPSNGSGLAPSHRMTIATSYVAPTSMCPSSQDFLEQSLNGDIKGCFRVPALNGSPLLVSMFAYLDDGVKPTGPTTTLTPSSPTGDLTLTLGTRTATPGESVTISGRYSSQPPSPRQAYANICWDGCLTGLQEQGVPIRWTSPSTFQTVLRVPETAWLQISHGAVSPHPLRSGSYPVGIQCLGQISGCALGPGDAHTTLTLKAPTPSRCEKGQRCETMHLSTKSAEVGGIVEVTGWAPLQTIIGQPFGYELSITKAGKRHDFPALTCSQNRKGGGLNVVLAPRVLRVAPSKSWASLGRVAYVSSSFAGPSPVTPASDSHLIAWCQPSGLVVTGGTSTIRISTHGAAAALVGTPLSLFSSSPSNPACATVLLDPTHRDSIFAGFGTDAQGSAPPVYIAGEYTTDGGVSWHIVPVPAGYSIEDFGGFRAEGDRVLALFAGPNSYQNRRFASGTEGGVLRAEATSNGGISWSTSTLGCPPSGPCATLGPFEWGNCAMNGANQPLLVGPPAPTTNAVVKWRSSTWVTSFNSCFSQQLVATSPHDLLLLDPSSQYPLLKSTDSGMTWSYLTLPSIKGFNYGNDSVPLDNYLLMAPDGSLFATLTVPSGTRQELFRLKPGAIEWCQVPKAFGSTLGATVTTMRVTPTDLIWNQSVYPSSGAEVSSMHVASLSSLHC
jgi:hypothetical protein